MNFKPVYLLNPLYVVRRLMTVGSMTELCSRLRNVLILSGKLVSGRYSERYWAQQRIDPIIRQSHDFPALIEKAVSLEPRDRTLILTNIPQDIAPLLNAIYAGEGENTGQEFALLFDRFAHDTERSFIVLVFCIDYVESIWRIPEKRHIVVAILNSMRARVPDNNLYLSNKILNRIEYLEGTPVLSSKPVHLIATLSTLCNLQCRMCYDRKPWEIPGQIREEVVALLPFLERVFWIGGEVLMLPWFEELFDRAAAFPRLRQGITTNGVLIGERWADKLVKAGAEVVFSVDSPTRHTYEYLRKGASFDDLRKALRCYRDAYRRYYARPDRTLHDNPPSSAINFVIMRDNCDEMKKIIDFAREYEIPTVNFVNLADFNRAFYEQHAVNNEGEDGAMLEERVRAAKEYAAMQGIGALFNFTLPDQRKYSQRTTAQADNDVAFLSQPAPRRPPCRIPWDSMEIAGDVVRPSCQCPQNVGDIRQQSLEEIWNGPLYQAYRRAFVRRQHDMCPGSCAFMTRKEENLFNK